jgi:hypothetical protein
LVARAREAGLDPELELRVAARRYADEVREREQGRVLSVRPVARPGRGVSGRRRPECGRADHR